MALSKRQDISLRPQIGHPIFVVSYNPEAPSYMSLRTRCEPRLLRTVRVEVVATSVPSERGSMCDSRDCPCLPSGGASGSGGLRSGVGTKQPPSPREPMEPGFVHFGGCSNQNFLWSDDAAEGVLKVLRRLYPALGLDVETGEDRRYVIREGSLALENKPSCLINQRQVLVHRKALLGNLWD